MGLYSVAMVPRSVACTLQESSTNQTSKNSGITAHSTGEGGGEQPRGLIFRRKKAAGS